MNPTVIEFAKQFPIIGVGMLGFLGLLAACLVPCVRRTLGDALDIPLPSTKQHMRSLDSFRGLAALWVATFHCWQWTRPAFYGTADVLPFIMRGDYGVYVFVVLSGFLIFRSLRNLRDLDHLASYFWRRILRIYPLYFATSLLLILYLHPHKIGAALADLLMLRSLGYPNFLNPPAWSVYVELMFYFVMPAFVLLARKRSAIAAAVVVVVLFVCDIDGSPEYSLWKYFFVGVLCSEFVEYAMRTKIAKFGALLFLLGCGLVALTVYSEFNHGLLGFSERRIVIGLGTGAVLCGAILSKSIGMVLSIKPLRVLGAVSYSIYLVHSVVLIYSFGLTVEGNGRVAQGAASNFIAQGTPAFLVYLCSIVFFACCTFLLVERPALRLRSRF